MSNTLFGTNRTKSEPDNPRTTMEPSDMDPDDAREFIYDLMRGIHNRMREMPEDRFESPDTVRRVPSGERGKQYYGSDTYQLLSGILAALREWDESGTNTKDLKEKYDGKFVEGVEIGERLAVYQGSDFEFTEGTSSGTENDSKFTFVQ